MKIFCKSAALTWVFTGWSIFLLSGQTKLLPKTEVALSQLLSDKAPLDHYAALLAGHCLDLKENHKGNQTRLVRKVFYQTQKRFFGTFSFYTPLEELLSRGEYNCLSGTALYALIFEELGIAYEIRETAFHAYLCVYPKNGDKILIESTDKAFGFIIDKALIAEREREYTYPKEAKSEADRFNRQVSLEQLPGLQYYNQAVVKFNEQAYDDAEESLRKAQYYYDCDRVENLQVMSRRYAHPSKEVLQGATPVK